MFHSTRHRIALTTVKPLFGLASLAMTPNARAQQVQADTEKRTHNLELKYPGSTLTQVLKSHGKDGRYLVLVVGPFANLS